MLLGIILPTTINVLYLLYCASSCHPPPRAVRTTAFCGEIFWKAVGILTGGTVGGVTTVATLLVATVLKPVFNHHTLWLTSTLYKSFANSSLCYFYLWSDASVY